MDGGIVNDIVILGKAGIMGIFIGLLGLCGLLIRMVYKLVTNHFSHTNKVIQEHTEASTKLSEAVKGNTEVVKDLRDIIIKR